MVVPDEYDEKLLRNQPNGHKGRLGRLLRSGGGHYRRPCGGREGTLVHNLQIALRLPLAVLKITRYGHGGSARPLRPAA